MKIAFFREIKYRGKIPRDDNNLRTDLAWMVALNADHFHLNETPNQQYDLGIVIIPKKDPQFDIDKLKQHCTQIAVM